MVRRKTVADSKSTQIELSSLLWIDDLDNFREVRTVPATANEITPAEPGASLCEPLEAA